MRICAFIHRLFIGNGPSNARFPSPVNVALVKCQLAVSIPILLQALMDLSPGMTDIVFRARRTLKVRSAETLPRSTNSVTYL